jgi:hypothetical protein
MAGITDIYSHYEIKEIRSLRKIKELFPEGYETKNNWLFCSMQGVHGTHFTLDEIENILENAEEIDKYWITVLIVQPRLCNLFYGEIPVRLKEIPYLRSLVKNTIEVIPSTQKGNT